MVLVIAGEGSRGLGGEIAQRLGADWGEAEVRAFPDGEFYARIVSPVQGQDVILVQTTHPQYRLMHLLLLLNACKENGARRVRAVVPYLAYARQDRVFKPGEALSSRLVAETLGLYAEQVVTVDAHKNDVGQYYRIPFVNAPAEVPLAQELKRLKTEVVLAPDAGAMPRAKAVAKRIGAKFDYLEKKRITSEIVETKPKSLAVRGKTVCILDDIISTGGTMAKALEQLMQNGARETYAACVHGLFQGDAVDKIRRAGAKEILATNTIESPYSRASVAGVLCAGLGVKTSSVGARR